MQRSRLDQGTAAERGDDIEALCMSEPATDSAADYRCCAAADAALAVLALHEWHAAELAAWVDS